MMKVNVKFILSLLCANRGNGGVVVHPFFKKNQQFITWGVRADRGSYFITTYKTNRLHDGRKGKGKKEERKN